ncbi:cytochrome c oxidase subunit 1 [Linnemannia gamsii]|uniref:Cytochrome c oxidase subunit 1 n=1 Tax=Linnemannia gamsii TaxID=64522 RepID=A0ABQ7JWU2_9FUNG|nr:cytochrome c oxidase subunit 1 [Linnemannia gamsii]
MPSNGGGGAGSMSFSDRFFSRRLGGLYRLFQATILLYIASSIIYQQRYLKTENVINGAVRVTLKAPLDGVATPTYCKPSQVISPSQPGATPPCLYWSSNDILYETGVDGALVTTRAQITQYGPFNNQTTTQPQKCDVNAPIVAGCDPHTAPTTLLLPTSLVADIERFTLMLEHSIRGQATGLQIRSGNMEAGLLRDSRSGEVLKTFTDQTRYVPASTYTVETDSMNASVTSSATATMNGSKIVHLAGDVMTVGEFLKAAGVNLDEISTSPSAAVNETVRSSGVVVIVVIQYAAKGWNPNKISYEYLPKAIPDQEYKVIETIRDFRGGNRVEINRHGIRIVFSQAGQLGQFSLMTLLTNLVAAVALFKVANIIVELMMLRLHPQKKIYTRAKFEHAKDLVPEPRRDGTCNSSTTGLEGLTAGEEESRTGSDSSFRGRSLHEGQESATVTPGSSTSALGSGKMTARSGRLGGQQQHMTPSGFSRRGGIDEEAAPRTHDEELEDFLTDSDDSENSDVDFKGDRRGSYVHDSLAIQSSSADPTRSQLRVMVSRLSSGNLSGYGSKDACRSATTPISTNGTVGRHQGSQLTKAVTSSATAMSGVDWNRNGSSSALNGGDVTPGVARTTAFIRPSGTSMYGLGQGYGSVTPRDSTDEIEIETRLGPVRLNDYRGFNPGGLSLTGTPPLSPSPSQARYAFGGSMRRGSATPERSTVYGVSTPSPTRAGSVEPFSAFRSPATMQAASPSPVYFGHQHYYKHSSMDRRGSVAEDEKGSSSRTKKHPSIKKSTGLASPSSPQELTRTLKSRHSSGSLSSLSSSSSSSSLASFYEGDQQRSFGLGQTGAGVGGSGARSSSSTWPYGLPDSPLRGECHAGESFAGSGNRSATHHHCSRKDKSANTGGSGGREHKKRRKEYNQSTTSETLTGGRYESPLQSKSEVILTRPMFGLGSSSNMSSFSLLLASAESPSSKDVKGKHVDSKWSVQESSSSTSTPAITPATTTAFNVTMAPFQLPMPAYFSQGLGSKLDLEDALAGFPSSSSSAALTSTTSSGKQPQRGGSLRRTLRSSVSSPSLLTGHRDATTAIAAASGLPVSAQLASHSDLPPKSGTVEPSLISSSSSSRSGSVSGQDATISSQSLFDASSAFAGSSAVQTESGDEQSAGARFLPTGSVGHFAHSTLDQSGDSRSGTPGVASYMSLQGPTPSLVNAVSHFSGASSSFTTSETRYQSSSTGEFNVTRASAEYPFTRTPTSTADGVTSTTTRAAPLPLRPILSTSSHLQSHQQQQHPKSPYSLTPSPGFPITTPISSIATPTIPDTSPSSPALGGTTSDPQGYSTNLASTFFTSPITSSCTTTIPETGISVLGPTITMITASNRRLVLRRSAPLFLNEGVGEEKAARM